MIGANELRAGIKVFARHWRNAAGDPRRLSWVIARAFRILIGGHAGAVLQRHVVNDELYRDYPDWIDRYDTLNEEAGREDEREGTALPVADQMVFGRQSASGATDRMVRWLRLVDVRGCGSAQS